MSVRTVLVTGGSGVVGAEVCAELAARGDMVVALVHRASKLVRNNGKPLRDSSELPVAPVSGLVVRLGSDVRDARLGLGPDTWERLASSVDLIVHSAAITDFNRDAAVYESVNVQGTQHVLALARHRRSIPLLHVSTAYVCGERSGVILENELEAGQSFGNGYEESKFRAEVLVRRAAAAGHPVAIARPSIIVGTCRSGVIREFKHIYIVMKLVTEGKIRSIPANYDATLDLVPVDYVVRGIVEIATNIQKLVGKTFHLVTRTPTTLRDFSDVLAEYPSLRVPHFVPPRSFDAEAMDPIERRVYEHTVRIFECYFRRRIELVDDTTVTEIGSALPARPRGRALLRKQIDYCESVGYLGRAAIRPGGPEPLEP